MKILWNWIATVILTALGTSGLAGQTITSFSPSSAPEGSTVTVTGTGFSTTIANNIVYFGAGRGTVTLASVTSLSVTVPTSATYGPVSVSVVGTGKSATSHNFFDPKAKIIVVTDHADRFFRKAAQAAGAHSFVSKEDLSELHSIIRGSR